MILTEHIQACLDDLAAAEKAMSTKALGTTLTRVRMDFGDRIKEIHKILQTRLDKAKRAEPSSTLWRDFETDRKACHNVVRECLAFVEGSLMRVQGFDCGLCPIADALLRQLNEAAKLGWNSFTLPADGESFAGLAEVVRLRFPVTGIWDLPIAAHEFGHFAASKLKPGEEPRDDYFSFQSERIKPYLDELFADAFATFALGPAFVRTCLFRRFHPASANTESDGKHPSFTWRAYLTLGILEQMGKTVREYVPVSEVSADRWRLALAQAGQEPIERDKDLDTMVRDCYSFLKRAAPRLEYTSWPAAQELSTQLEEPGGTQQFSLSDLVNASWIARLKPGSNSREISQYSMQLGLKMATRTEYLK
jgi:hypothetical protein